MKTRVAVIAIVLFFFGCGNTQEVPVCIIQYEGIVSNSTCEAIVNSTAMTLTSNGLDIQDIHISVEEASQGFCYSVPYYMSGDDICNNINDSNNVISTWSKPSFNLFEYLKDNVGFKNIDKYFTDILSKNT